MIVQKLTDVPLTMSSRELAELTGKEHKNVLADIRKMLSDLDLAAADFSATASASGPNGSMRRVAVYLLPKRESLILVSGYSVELRAKIIDRWQELEAGAAPALNMRDPRQLTAAALQLIEVNQELHAQVNALSPKAEALSRIALADGSMCVMDAAKALQLRPKDLFSWLQEHQWIYRRAGSSGFIGYQSRVQVGYLEHKVTTMDRPDGSSKIVEQVRITAKGLARLAEILVAKEAA